MSISGYLDLQFEKARKLFGNFTILFFTVGLIIDSIGYWSNSMNFLFFANVLTLLIISYAFLLKRSGKIKIRDYLLMCLISITLNLIFTLIRVVLKFENVNNPEFIIFRNFVFELLIILALSFSLNSKWAYYISALFSIIFTLIAILFPTKIFIENAVLVPMILFGITYTNQRFLKIVLSYKEKVIEAENASDHLSKLLVNEQVKYEKKLNFLATKIEKVDSVIATEINTLNKNLKNSLTNSVWYYTKEMSDAQNVYFISILKTHPNLTPTELNLCYLLANNKTTKQIAEIISCTPDSVKVLRGRLRKKLNLEHTQNLNKYLQTFFLEDN